MRKILISSDPNGRFDLLIPKVTELHNKNKFDFMLIVGSVCPIQSTNVFKQLSQKVLSFPLPTYFIDNSQMSTVFGILHPNGFQIVPNLFYLGNKGYQQIKGIKICYVSGVIKNNLQLSSGNRFQFSKQQAKMFIEQHQNKLVDILLTNQWGPQYISLQGTNPQKNQIISQICYELSPRYHIAAGGTKYLRLPAFKGKKGNPTHFLNVAQIKDSLPKQKYLVAIQLDPQIPQIIQNMGENPLVKNVEWNLKQPQQAKPRLVMKAQLNNSSNHAKKLDQTSFIMFQGFPNQTPDSQITQFMQKWGEIKQIQVFKKLKGDKKHGIVRFTNLKDAQICLKDSGKYSMYQSRIKFQLKQQNEKYNIKDCFLCQGNQRFDLKLLVHKANFCFVCVDKGPVTKYHFQIVPINHVSSTGQLQKQQQQQIVNIRKIFQNHFNSEGYTFVCIQRYMNLSTEINHAILHCIPIKMGEQQMINKFKSINHQNRYGFDQFGQTKNKQFNSPYYIIIQINNIRFIKNIDRKDKKFQQGRQIICEILDKPEKLNWRDCQLKDQQVKQLVKELQSIIK